MAGLRRLGLDRVARAPIDPQDMLPAIAQGAIGVEQRRGDDAISELLAAIHDLPTGHRLDAERAFLAALDGSCQTPIAGLAELRGETLRLRGEILRPDGSECLSVDVTGSIGEAERLGDAAGAELRLRAPADFFAS
jgi:hydroxymethylbilane synthase